MSKLMKLLMVLPFVIFVHNLQAQISECELGADQDIVCDTLVPAVILTSPLTSVNTGDQVCVDVSVSDFQYLVSFTYMIGFDPSVLQLNSINELMLLPQILSFNTDEADQGKIGVLWFNAIGGGICVENNSSVYELCFDVIGDIGDNTDVFISDGTIGGVNFILEYGISTDNENGICTNDSLLSTPLSINIGQNLSINFESTITTSDFIDFDGGTATVIDNPQANGINTSTKVAQIVREGGQIWGGSKINLAANLDFSTMNLVSMKVFTSAPVGTTVKIKLEGAGETERDVVTTVSDEWEELTWDFTGAPSDFNSIVFMFDFGNVGDGSETSTFLFDDISQSFGGIQIDFPVDFESTEINYTVTDFGGNVSSLVEDPTNTANKVIQTIKTDQAATWAGTTIGTPAGFATDIPLTLSNSKMTVRVWSPDAGTTIRLKVEDSDDPTHTCETETNTTLSGEWEELEFDFVNEAPGTQSLSVGLGMGWTYNKASIFFNFDAKGETAGEKTYYFDDVEFGGLALGTSIPEIEDLKVFPNPSYDEWVLDSKKEAITTVNLFDIHGRLIISVSPDRHTVKIDASKIAAGVYLAKVSTQSSTSSVRLIKE